MILFTDFECKVSAFCAKRQIFGVYSPKHKHTLCEMGICLNKDLKFLYGFRGYMQ